MKPEIKILSSAGQCPCASCSDPDQNHIANIEIFSPSHVWICHDYWTTSKTHIVRMLMRECIALVSFEKVDSTAKRSTASATSNFNPSSHGVHSHSRSSYCGRLQLKWKIGWEALDENGWTDLERAQCKRRLQQVNLLRGLQYESSDGGSPAMADDNAYQSTIALLLRDETSPLLHHLVIESSSQCLPPLPSFYRWIGT